MAKDQELLQAVKSNDIATVRKILAKIYSAKSKKGSKSKYNLNIQDEDGFTPLHHASLTGNTDIAMSLLDMECNVNARDRKGMSPLHLAGWAGKTEIAKLLIEARSCVNLCSDSGETPLHLACQHCNVGVVEVLLDANADATVINKNGESALDLACRFGHIHVVDLLLHCKDFEKLLALYEENPSSADPPLHLSCKTGRGEIVMMLIESGADVNQSGANGTALHEAALYGKTDVVKILLDHGADVSITNEEGYTPLDLVLQFTSSRASADIKNLLKDASKNRRVTAKALRDYCNIYDPTALAFKTGDVIEILEQNETGRWKGKTTIGKKETVGYFPSSMVKLANPRKTPARTSLMKDAAVLPMGKYEMVTLPNASQPSPLSSRLRMSSFGKPNSKRSKSPPSSREGTDDEYRSSLTESPAKRHYNRDPIANGLQDSELFRKTKQSLQYVEVSVEKSLSPVSTTSTESTSSRTQYAEVVLPPTENGVSEDEEEEAEAPSLPQKLSKHSSSDAELDADIWVPRKGSVSKPQLPPKVKKDEDEVFERPRLSTPAPGMAPVEPSDTSSDPSRNSVDSSQTSQDSSPNSQGPLWTSSKPSKTSPETLTSPPEIATTSPGASQTYHEPFKTSSEPSTTSSETSQGSPEVLRLVVESASPARIHSPELSRKGYEDMTLSSPEREEPTWDPSHRMLPPRKLDFREPALTYSTDRRQVLSYENVEVKQRSKPVPQSMLITEVDQPLTNTDDDEYVTVNQGVAPAYGASTTVKHRYENVPQEIEVHKDPREPNAPSYESMEPGSQDYESMSNVEPKRTMGTEGVQAPEGYEPMRGEGAQPLTDYEPMSDSGTVLRRVERTSEPPAQHSPRQPYENIELKSNQLEPGSPGDYVPMNDEPITPGRAYININVPGPGGGPGSARSSSPSGAPTGLSMHEYNSLYDWLESCKLAIYVDNFVRGGFDMVSITGLTPEDLTAINITKTGHRKKLLSESAKRQTPAAVFPKQKPADIMTWLQQIQLEQYIPQFMDGGFDDMDFVQDMAMEDLESIGITRTGHQRKIWMAVNALRNNDASGAPRKDRALRVVTTLPTSGGSIRSTSPSSQGRGQDSHATTAVVTSTTVTSPKKETKAYMETDLDTVTSVTSSGTMVTKNVTSSDTMAMENVTSSATVETEAYEVKDHETDLDTLLSHLEAEGVLSHPSDQGVATEGAQPPKESVEMQRDSISLAENGILDESLLEVSVPSLASSQEEPENVHGIIGEHDLDSVPAVDESVVPRPDVSPTRTEGLPSHSEPQFVAERHEPSAQRAREQHVSHVVQSAVHSSYEVSTRTSGSQNAVVRGDTSTSEETSEEFTRSLRAPDERSDLNMANMAVSKSPEPTKNEQSIVSDVQTRTVRTPHGDVGASRTANKLQPQVVDNRSAVTSTPICDHTSGDLEGRARISTLDSSPRAKRPPPPVKPKSLKKAAPKIPPKPAVPHTVSAVSRRSKASSFSGETEHSTSTAIVTVSTEEVPSKTSGSPVTSSGSPSSQSSSLCGQAGHVMDRQTVSDAEQAAVQDTTPTLDQQIKSVLRKPPVEGLLSSEGDSQQPEPTDSQQDSVTDEELQKDLDCTENLFKDINSMLSDFSTELDFMFDNETGTS